VRGGGIVLERLASSRRNQVFVTDEREPERNEAVCVANVSLIATDAVPVRASQIHSSITNASVLAWYCLGSRVVSVLDSGAEGLGFKSQSRRCRVTVLGKLFTPIVPLFTKQQNW